ATAAARLCDKHGLKPDHARQLVIDGLLSGEVSGVWIDPYGKRRQATPADFGDKDIDFDDEPLPTQPAIVREGDAAAGFSMVMSIVEDWLEINLLSLDRCVAAVLGAAASTETGFR